VLTGAGISVRIFWLFDSGDVQVSTERFEVVCLLSGGCHVPPQSVMTNISANPLSRLRAALAMEQASVPALVPVMA